MTPDPASTLAAEVDDGPATPADTSPRIHASDGKSPATAHRNVGRVINCIRAWEAGNGWPFSFERLWPLALCCIGFGWFASFFAGDRGFFEPGFRTQIVPVLFLGAGSLALSIAAVRHILRPAPGWRREAVGALLFTMLVGLPALLLFYELAQASLDVRSNSFGRASGFVLFAKVIGALSLPVENPGFWHGLARNVVGVGLCEELIKMAPLFYLILKRQSKDQPLSFRMFLMTAYFSGLGFGTGEALLGYSPWSSDPFLGSNLIRWFACVPLHGVYTMIDGVFVWLVADRILRTQSWNQRALLAAGAAVTIGVLHGIYNSLHTWSLFNGLALDALSIAMLYFLTNVATERQPAVLHALMPADEPVAAGVDAGDKRLRHLCTGAFVSILLAGAVSASPGAAGSSESSHSPGHGASVARLRSAYGVDVTLWLYTSYAALYQMGVTGEGGFSVGGYRNLERELQIKYPERSLNEIRFVASGIMDGHLGLPMKVAGIDPYALPKDRY